MAADEGHCAHDDSDNTDGNGCKSTQEGHRVQEAVRDAVLLDVMCVVMLVERQKNSCCCHC